MTRSPRALSRRVRRHAIPAGAALAALLLAAPAAHAVPRAAATTVPVTFAVKAYTGLESPTLTVFDRATWQKYELSGVTKTTLAPGSYVAVAQGMLPGPADAAGVTGMTGYLMVRTFTVASAAQTVTFDTAATKNVSLHTDDTTAEQTGAVGRITTSGSVEAAETMTVSALRVSPFSVPGLSLSVHETLQRAGSSQASPTPFVYDLAHVWKDTVPASPTLKWNRAQLATTTVVVHGPGTRQPTRLWTATWLTVPLEVPVTGAGKFVQYTSPNVQFQGSLGSGTGDYSLGGWGSHPSGWTGSVTVGTGPAQPARDTGTFTDGSGSLTSLASEVRDRTGAGLQSARVTRSAVLTDGAQTWTSDAGGNLRSDQLPPGERDFTLRSTTVATSALYRLSSRTEDVWSFRANPSGRSQAPLIDPDVSVSGLDAFNHLGTGPVTVSVSATSRTAAASGAVTVTGISWSADDGARWTGLPVTAGTKAGTATAPLTVPASAPWVSLRVTAADALGNTVTRTLVRAAGGPAATPETHTGALTVSDVSVAGTPAAVTAGTTLTASYTVTDLSGTAATDVVLYHGTYDRPTGVLTATGASCTTLSATARRCTAELSTPGYLPLPSVNGLLRLGAANAGTWHLAVVADSATGHLEDHDAATVTLARKAHLSTVDVTPEPVTKGGRITATGTLTHDDWDGTAPSGYAGRSVKLQYSKGTSAWSTVATGTTDATGKVRVGAPAPAANGRYRLAYTDDPGGAVLSATDGVTVR